MLTDRESATRTIVNGHEQGCAANKSSRRKIVFGFGERKMSIGGMFCCPKIKPVVENAIQVQVVKKTNRIDVSRGRPLHFCDPKKPRVHFPLASHGRLGISGPDMKNIATRSIVLGVVVGGNFIFANLSAKADEEVTIELKDDTAFGSGSSGSDELYSPGGDQNVGLYLGNPNVSMRNDRALFSFELDSLLLKTNKIKKAELVFWVDYYDNSEPKVDVEVSRFFQMPDELSGRQLNDPDVESVGTVEIVAKDALNGPGGALEKRVDVTGSLKADLTDGHTTATFRLSVPDLEGKPVLRESQGLIISAARNSAEKVKWPTLVVTLGE